jgi:hypothetical protein
MKFCAMDLFFLLLECTEVISTVTYILVMATFLLMNQSIFIALIT